VLIVGHLGSVKSSLELAAALYKAAPHLPIVLATKWTEEICADRLMFAGIADVVHWPIVAAEIAAALNRCSQLIPARFAMVFLLKRIAAVKSDISRRHRFPDYRLLVSFN
jgi:DNA-binding LytR/AlgR family response regulator